jgi:CHASE3 domain sensor protein
MNDLKPKFYKIGFVIGLVFLFLTAGMVFWLANSSVQSA